MPRRGIDLTEEQWRHLKTMAAANLMTQSQYIAALLERPGIVPVIGAKPDAKAPEAIFELTAQDLRNPYAEFHPVPKPGKKK